MLLADILFSAGRFKKHDCAYYLNVRRTFKNSDDKCLR